MRFAAGRVASCLLVSVTAASAAALFSGCGGGNGQVSVTMQLAQGSPPGPYKPGDTPSYVVDVTNHGPGDAPGVQVRVDLPSTFKFKATDNLGGQGGARTQPLDPTVGVSSPLWGYWNLAAPSGDQPAHVSIKFTVEVGGKPDTYSLIGNAQGDNTAGLVSSAQLPVVVVPAAKLAVQATVSPATVKPSSLATYRITITNSGDGPAGNVSVLIALPPVLSFQQSVTPFPGNSSRSSPLDPVKNSVEAFYGGFNIPADSSAGPGFLTIVFKAAVVAKPAQGTYPISVQLTDAAADKVFLVNAAPISVSGG